MSGTIKLVYSISNMETNVFLYDGMEPFLGYNQLTLASDMYEDTVTAL